MSTSLLLDFFLSRLGLLLCLRLLRCTVAHGLVCLVLDTLMHVRNCLWSPECGRPAMKSITQMSDFMIPLDGSRDIPSLEAQLGGNVDITEPLLLQGDDHRSLHFTHFLIRGRVAEYSSSCVYTLKETIQGCKNVQCSFRKMRAFIWSLNMENRTRNGLTRRFFPKVARYRGETAVKIALWTLFC